MTMQLRVWDGPNVIFDVGTRTGRLIDIIEITSSNLSGSVSPAEFAQGTPFYYYTSYSAGAYINLQITLTGTTLSWAPPPGWNPEWPTSAFLYYGVR